MRRAQYVAALAAGALLVVGAPVAQAAEISYRGGCGMDATSDTTPGGQLGGQDVYNGVVYVTAVLYSLDTIPVTATVTCELRVNGASQGDVLTVTGTGVVSSVGQLQFTSSDSDVVTLCMHISAGEELETCGDTTDIQVPPQEVSDLVSELVSQVDPTMCPVLAALAPGVPGVADINAEGDTQVFGGPFWDCPPYDSFSAADADEPPADPGNGNGKHKHKDPGTQSGSTTSQPAYPSATITMTQTLGGPVNTFSTPGWTCTPNANQMTSVSCDPPAAPTGYYNVCGTVTVSVKSNAVGTVAATSSCASGTFASATSVGPATNPSTDSANPNSDFPWTCAANPGGSLDWTVTCTVN